MLTTALTIGPLWLSTDQERRKRIYLNCQMDHVSEDGTPRLGRVPSVRPSIAMAHIFQRTTP